MSKEVERDLSWVVKAIDMVVEKQRPLVVKHLKSVRAKRPDVTPAEMIERLEKQYLAAVSTSGAAVGATAVAPGVGTVTSLGLTVAETVAFLEASAFFSQAITEVHGIHVDDPERSKALVMSLMMGKEGSSLVRRVAEQGLGRGASRDAFWGQLITTNLPSGFVANTVVDYLKRAFFRRMAAMTGRSAIGRAVPFGIGAVIGGVGNHLLGKAVVKNAREAFGPAPAHFNSSLNPDEKAERKAKERREKKPRKTLREQFEAGRNIERRGLSWRNRRGDNATGAEGDTPGSDTPES